MSWKSRLTPHRMRQLWYAPLLVLAMGLMMLRMLVMARVLDVQAFAQFSGGMLISSTFCMLGGLGLQPMLQREWPAQIVRGQELRALMRASQSHLVAVATLVIGCLAAGLGLSPPGMSAGLLAVGLLHGLSHQVFLVSTVESRSRGDALRFSWQNLIRAIAALGLSVGAALLTGSAQAALAIDALVTLALSLEYTRRSFAHVRLGIRPTIILAARQLRTVPWRSALTMMLVLTASFATLNADRWIASAVLDVAGFAQYSFAWIVLAIAQAAQVIVNASVFPLVARRFAEQGRPAAFRVCWLASGGVLAAGVVAGVGCLVLLPLVVSRWYPQYVDSLVLLPWFLAVAILRASDFWSSFMLICGLESSLLRINLVGTALVLAGWALLVRPWGRSPLAMEHVAGLALALTVLLFVAIAGASWRARLE